MSLKAAQHVACLKVGDLMYTPKGDKVTITEISDNFKFWYVDDRQLDWWSDRESLIERFMEFGPIDNDLIIVHEVMPKVTIQNAKPEADMVNSPSHYTAGGIEYIKRL